MPSSQPDKQLLYGDFRDAQKRREKLHMRLAHKALDIPEDEDVIQANRYGMGWKELLALGLIGIGVWQVATRMQPAPPASGPPLSSPAATSPADSEYDVRFFDRDGRPIDVPHISTRPK